MATDRSIQIAACCWAEPSTCHSTVDPELGMVFAEALDREALDREAMVPYVAAVRLLKSVSDVEPFPDTVGVISQLDNYIAGRWISVNDRLPDSCDRVLVCGVDEGGDKFTDTGSYIDPFGWLDDVDEWVDTVTHWMSLPQPPN